MQRFGAPGGLGETLQQKLLERQKKTANWVRVVERGRTAERGQRRQGNHRVGGREQMWRRVWMRGR